MDPYKTTNRLRKKIPTIHRSKHLIFISFTSLFIIFLIFFFSDSHTPTPQICQNQKALNKKFMFYAPHSGFSNQLSEFKNAILMAAILNRTLIVPPVLDHHAVALGSCPKFRVLDPKDLRIAVWNHVIELIQSNRYVSMADIIDISSLVSDPSVSVIDFRNFVSIFCDININHFCNKDSKKMNNSLLKKLQQCGSLSSGYNNNINNCVYAVEKDCRTTVWTYRQLPVNCELDSFQPDEQLKIKKKISFIRRRKDVYETLGPYSQANLATVLSFGSLFTTPYKGSESYIDIHEAPRDQKVHSLIKKIEFLPFVREILDAGKSYAFHTIKSPFVCAQLRLLDGQFKNHQRATFERLKRELDSLRKNQSSPIYIFVMTDLPLSNWTDSSLRDLLNDSGSTKTFMLTKDDKLIRETAEKVVEKGYGMRFGGLAENGIKNECFGGRILPDILLHVEETVCSCASLGFLGTAGSTIADSIEMMRSKQICSH